MPCVQVPPAKQGDYFLKGLAVVGGIAYFGINELAPRNARADTSKDAELAAVHVASGMLLWRRTLPTR